MMVMWNGSTVANDCDIPLPEDFDETSVVAFTPKVLGEPPVLIEADAVQHKDRLWLFSGDAQLNRYPWQLNAQQLHYDPDTEMAIANDDVRIVHENQHLLADEFRGRLEPPVSESQTVWLRTAQPQVQLWANRLQQPNAQRVQGQQVTMTTCHNPALGWVIEADGVSIDYDLDRLVLRDAWFVFLEHHLLYTPYISFPADGRGSGWLSPSIGGFRHVDPETQQVHEGYLVDLSFYWDMAPNRDLTLRHGFSHEGEGMLDAEYRYLQSNHQGTVQLGWDSGIQTATTNNPVTNYRRLAWQGRWQTSTASQLVWQWTGIEDPYVFKQSLLDEDKQNDTKLVQQLDWTLSQGIHQHRVGVQVNEGLQSAAETVGYAPKWQWRAKNRLTPQSAWQWRWFSDVTQFDYFQAQRNQPIGQRWVVEPSLTWQSTKPWMTWENQWLLRSWGYDVRNEHQAASVLGTCQDDGSRTWQSCDDNQWATAVRLKQQINWIKTDVPLWSASSYSGSEQGGWVHEIKPQWQWVYAQADRQAHLPYFDSADLAWNVSQLWQVNRFSGYDRFGDTHHVALGLAQDFYHTKHPIRLNVQLGQQYYLADRQVHLTHNEAQTDEWSDFVAQQSLDVYNHRLTANETWLHETGELDDVSAVWQWQQTPQWQWNLTYLLENQASDATTETAQVAWDWLITPELRWTHQLAYDIHQDQWQKSLLAVTLQTCCYNVSLSQQSTYDETLNQWDRRLYVSLTLSQLNTFGRDIASEIRETVGFAVNP